MTSSDTCVNLASRAHRTKMWKFLSKDPSNAQTIKKAQDAEDKKKKKFDVLKSLQKALGQTNKKESMSYTSIPTKLSLTKKAGENDEFMLSMEINMYCKQAAGDILGEIAMDRTLNSKSMH